MASIRAAAASRALRAARPVVCQQQPLHAGVVNARAQPGLKRLQSSRCPAATPAADAVPAGRAGKTLTITQPDDFHVHFRDGAGVLGSVVPHTAARFARALVMPNLVPPVTTTDAAMKYHDRIMEAAPPGGNFQPMMTLYLTDDTTPEEVIRTLTERPDKCFLLFCYVHADITRRCSCSCLGCSWRRQLPVVW